VQVVVQPRYLTWGGFKASSACGGPFIGSIAIWCEATSRFNRIVSHATQSAVHAELSCGGTVVEATVAGTAGEGLAAEAFGFTWKAKNLPIYAASGMAGCLAGKMFDAVWSF
jgi:hypothetical protein